MNEIEILHCDMVHQCREENTVPSSLYRQLEEEYEQLEDEFEEFKQDVFNFCKDMRFRELVEYLKSKGVF